MPTTNSIDPTVMVSNTSTVDSSIYPTGIARAQAWLGLLSNLASAIGPHCKFDDDGYIKTLHTPAHFVNYSHLRKPLMGMRLDEYLFMFLDDTRVKLEVMSNARNYVIGGDVMNLHVEFAGIHIDIGGALATPQVPRFYPDAVEAKLYTIWKYLFALEVELSVKG